FDIVDPKTNDRVTVVYGQPKPENFDSATNVEAQGRYQDGVFHADSLLVKCPSKYRDSEKPDKKADSADAGLIIAVSAPTVVGVGAATWLIARKARAA